VSSDTFWRTCVVSTEKNLSCRRDAAQLSLTETLKCSLVVTHGHWS